MNKFYSWILLILGLILFMKIVVFSNGEHSKVIRNYQSKTGTITTTEITSNKRLYGDRKAQHREIFSFKLNNEDTLYIIDRYENGYGDLIRQLTIGDTVTIWLFNSSNSDYTKVVQVVKNGVLIESLADFQKREANQEGIVLLIAMGLIIIGLILCFDINIIKVLTSVVDGKEK